MYCVLCIVRFVVRRSLCAVCWLLFVDCCGLFVARCSLCVAVGWLLKSMMCVVCCLFVVENLWFAD